MADEELRLLTWQMQQMIPQLNTEYSCRSYTIMKGDSRYLVFEWSALRRVPIDEIRGVSWSEENGVFSFSMVIDRVLDSVSEDSRDDVITEITLEMPREVDSPMISTLTAGSFAG